MSKDTDKTEVAQGNGQPLQFVNIAGERINLGNVHCYGVAYPGGIAFNMVGGDVLEIDLGTGGSMEYEKSTAETTRVMAMLDKITNAVDTRGDQ
ncbi:MAG: hypothetical protein ACLFVJ_22605 [Persicimonas sp.]